MDLLQTISQQATGAVNKLNQFAETTNQNIRSNLSNLFGIHPSNIDKHKALVIVAEDLGSQTKKKIQQPFVQNAQELQNLSKTIQHTTHVSQDIAQNSKQAAENLKKLRQQFITVQNDLKDKNSLFSL